MSKEFNRAACDPDGDFLVNPNDPMARARWDVRQLVYKGYTLRDAVREAVTGGVWLRAEVYEQSLAWYWQWLSITVPGWDEDEDLRGRIYRTVYREGSELLSEVLALSE